MLQRDGGKHHVAREHLFETLPARFRVTLHDLPFLVVQMSCLREDLIGYSDLADIVQETAERKLKLLFLGKLEQNAEKSREDRHVDRMGERVGVVQAEIRELHEVLLLRDDVLQDRFGNVLQRPWVEGACLLYGLERCRHVVYGGDARLFPHDVFRRCGLEPGVHGCDGHSVES